LTSQAKTAREKKGTSLNGTVGSEVVLRAVVAQFGPQRRSRFLHKFVSMFASFENPRFEAARTVGDLARRDLAEHRDAMVVQLCHSGHH
jgi:hypothetical protein